MNTKTPPAQPARHTPGPHPVAVLDSPQWLRTFAMQYKGETRATLELCAARLDSAPAMLEALKLAERLIAANRHRFPKSIKHPDCFELNLTRAAIGKAIHNAEGRA